MSFEVIEQFIEGKESKDLCEDRIVLTKVVAGVIDGATSKSALSFGAMRQGKIAGILLEEVINGLTGAEDAYTFVERANDRFCAFYRERELLAHMASNPVDRLNASVVLYNDVRQELWMIGDCQAICGDRPYKNPKLIDEVLANLRSFYIQLALHQGATVEQLLQDDIGRRQILPHLKQQHAFQNNLPDSRFSYGTLDGFLQDKSKIKVYPITDEEIILASDGYPQLYPTLAQTEAHLQEVLAHDPLCYKLFLSTKGCKTGDHSFDDRAYLRIRMK